MAEVKLTRAQQAVVENRGGALLVSAAAGSGKTKVLGNFGADFAAQLAGRRLCVGDDQKLINVCWSIGFFPTSKTQSIRQTLMSF